MNILSDAVNEQRKHVLPSHLPNSHEKFIERLRTFDVCVEITCLLHQGCQISFL